MNRTLEIVRMSDEGLAVCMSYRLLHIFETKTLQSASLELGPVESDFINTTECDRRRGESADQIEYVDGIRL